MRSLRRWRFWLNCSGRTGVSSKICGSILARAGSRLWLDATSPFRRRICPCLPREGADQRSGANRRCSGRPLLEPCRHRLAVRHSPLLTTRCYGTDATSPSSPRSTLIALRGGQSGSIGIDSLGGRLVGLWQPELDSRSFTRLAPNLHSAARLRGKTLNHRQP